MDDRFGAAENMGVLEEFASQMSRQFEALRTHASLAKEYYSRGDPTVGEAFREATRKDVDLILMMLRGVSFLESWSSEPPITDVHHRLSR